MRKSGIADAAILFSAGAILLWFDFFRSVLTTCIEAAYSALGAPAK